MNIEKFGLEVDLEGKDITCVVGADRISEFFAFLKERADYFSLEYYYDGKISREQLKLLKEEGDRYIQRQYLAYKNNQNGYREQLKAVLGIETERDVKKYFKGLQKDYKKNILDEVKHQKGSCSQINEEILREKGMIECRLTCNTPSTMGSTRIIYYFPVEGLNGIIGEMETLYDYSYIDRFQFENLTFYKGDYNDEDNAFYITTTHESEAGFSINKKDFEELTNAKVIVSA